MTGKSIILVGNPDSGKSNYVARLWLALQSKKFDLFSPSPPDNIQYVEDIAAHLLQGRFSPRTDKDETKRNFEILIQSRNGIKNASILIPDVSGELWKKAVDTYEIPADWLTTLKSSSAALLFVRVLSDLNVQPLDWVNSQKLLEFEMETGVIDAQKEIPTQVRLIELLRFLEQTLMANHEKPKVAVIVTAWDLLHNDETKDGPEGYLKKEFPMFFGRLFDCSKLEIKIYGSSIVGGDLRFEEFVKTYFSQDPTDSGYIVTKDNTNTLKVIYDLTTPIKWLLDDQV